MNSTLRLSGRLIERYEKFAPIFKLEILLLGHSSAREKDGGGEGGRVRRYTIYIEYKLFEIGNFLKFLIQLNIMISACSQMLRYTYSGDKTSIFALESREKKRKKIVLKVHEFC